VTYTQISDECWLSIPGYRGFYEVSTSGRVRSCDRININRNGVRRLLRGKYLARTVDGEGYLQVSLFRGDGVETKARVHRLVAEVFVKNPHALPLVDHRNRVRADCRTANLRWVSYAGNRANSAQTGHGSAA
jgi:hypothetical protein